eukprot:4658685-Pyramimonas_sp.AAC.1
MIASSSGNSQALSREIKKSTARAAFVSSAKNKVAIVSTPKIKKYSLHCETLISTAPREGLAWSNFSSLYAAGGAGP